MARPTNKAMLLEQSEENFKKMFNLINSMTKEEQERSFSFEDRDKNIRDVLIHLYEWHNLLLKWIKNNTNGVTVNFLPEPYNWKTYPQMNVEIWKKHQTTKYDSAIEMLTNSHKEVMKLIDKFDDKELFDKKHFSWTGTTTLGAYCISATASHYDWAIKKIKAHKKSIS